MAQQKSTVQIQGTIGNLTFFKSQDGYMVKAKSEVSKEKILSDKAFARTRENMAEFGNAGKAGKALRTPFNNLLQLSADNRMVSRLTAISLRAIQTDTVSKRGKRVITNGDLLLLEDFEFNNKGILSSTLLVPYTITFARASGNVALDFEDFMPAQGIAAPEGATHFQLQMAASAVNFNARKNTAQQIASAILPWDNDLVSGLSLSLSLPAASTQPIFILLQIQFMTQLNTDYYPLKNGAYNACAIIKVDKP